MTPSDYFAFRANFCGEPAGGFFFRGRDKNAISRAFDNIKQASSTKQTSPDWACRSCGR